MDKSHQLRPNLNVAERNTQSSYTSSNQQNSPLPMTKKYSSTRLISITPVVYKMKRLSPPTAHDSGGQEAKGNFTARRQMTLNTHKKRLLLGPGKCPKAAEASSVLNSYEFPGVSLRVIHSLNTVSPANVVFEEPFFSGVPMLPTRTLHKNSNEYIRSI